MTDDVFVNIAGGMSIEEPAADLAIVSAVASSVRNRPLLPATAVFGEVGLGGEVRGVPQAGLRIREAEQMGFTRIVLPVANVDGESQPAQIDTSVRSSSVFATSARRSTPSSPELHILQP